MEADGSCGQVSQLQTGRTGSFIRKNYFEFWHFVSSAIPAITDASEFKLKLIVLVSAPLFHYSVMSMISARSASQHGRGGHSLPGSPGPAAALLPGCFPTRS